MGSNINKTTEQFIADAVAVHGDQYDYSKVKYLSAKTKVTITCPEHGEFEQTPTNHLRSQGCPKCGHTIRERSRLINALSKKYKGLVQPEEYKLIPLTQGKFAKVDNEDFDRCSCINWFFDCRYAKSNAVGYMHRFIMNAPDHLEVDHIIQENTLDNRRSNLRLATRPQNMANTRPRKGSSKYKGVSWDNFNSKWLVQIHHDGCYIKIGRFNSEDEAGMAYDRKAIELRGEFAYLNFPELKDEYLNK